ncbi:MAG: hypothetical protein ACXAEU_06660 [Candidatus Hodarchaeales archaeon]|jgi:hypothetical protein
MDDKEGVNKKELEVNYKGVLVPLGVSATGIVLYIIGNIIHTTMQSTNGNGSPVTVTPADIGRVIALWGLIIAFAGFLVVFLASGLILSMKTVAAGEPSKQSPTNIAEKYSQMKTMGDSTDVTDKFRKMKEMENFISEIDGDDG